MVDVLEKILLILEMPNRILSQAADALNNVEFDTMLLYEYLGYLHYAMGTPLYMSFATLALIMIGASLWTLIVKALNWLMGIIPIV